MRYGLKPIHLRLVYIFFCVVLLSIYYIWVNQSENILRFDFSPEIKTILNFIKLFSFLIAGLLAIIIKPKSPKSYLLAFSLLTCCVLLIEMVYPVNMNSVVDLVRKIIYYISFFFYPLLLHFLSLFPNFDILMDEHDFNILPEILVDTGCIFGPKPFYILASIFVGYDIFREIYIFIFNDGIWSNLWKFIEWDGALRYFIRILFVIYFSIVVLRKFNEHVIKNRYGYANYLRAKKMKWLIAGLIIGIAPTYIYDYANKFDIETFLPILYYGHHICQIIFPMFMLRGLLIKETKDHHQISAWN